MRFWIKAKLKGQKSDQGWSGARGGGGELSVRTALFSFWTAVGDTQLYRFAKIHLTTHQQGRFF